MLFHEVGDLHVHYYTLQDGAPKHGESLQPITKNWRGRLAVDPDYEDELELYGLLVIKIKARYWVVNEFFCEDFYHSLCAYFNGAWYKKQQCVVSAELVAERFGLSVQDAEEVMCEMCFYGITERQGGAYVI